MVFLISAQVLLIINTNKMRFIVVFKAFLISYPSVPLSLSPPLKDVLCLQDIQEAHAGQIVAVFGVDCASGVSLIHTSTNWYFTRAIQFIS